MVILDKLDKMSFCKGLPKDYLSRLVSLGEFRDYETGEYIFREGVSSEELFLLADGYVSLETSIPGQEPMRVQKVAPGELLGWSPILGMGVMTASARALQPCRVLALNAARILALADKDPKFVLEFMRRTAVTLARRLSATRLQVLAAYNNDGQAVS